MRSSMWGCCLLLLAFAVQVCSARDVPHGAITPDMLGAKMTSEKNAYCVAWMKNVEANNIKGGWKLIPDGCYLTIKKYMENGQYYMDLSVAADAAWSYLSSIPANGNGAVMFDIDETLLSTIEYQRDAGKYGSVLFNSSGFNAYVAKSSAVALKTSLTLYNKLKDAGYKLVICTGRREAPELRAGTEKNLIAEGYSGWSDLILRTPEYDGLTAGQYKAKARAKLEKEKGYSFKSCAGDQYSDCEGEAKGEQTFKFPNPIYYV